MSLCLSRLVCSACRMSSLIIPICSKIAVAGQEVSSKSARPFHNLIVDIQVTLAILFCSIYSPWTSKTYFEKLSCEISYMRRSLSKPTLDMHKGECIVSIIDNNNGITEPNHGYQNCSTNQMLSFGGYLKMREAFYTQIII